MTLKSKKVRLFITAKTKKILAMVVMKRSKTSMQKPQKKTQHQRFACSLLKGPKTMRRITLVH